jgi:hypothetical protein
VSSDCSGAYERPVVRLCRDRSLNAKLRPACARWTIIVVKPLGMRCFTPPPRSATVEEQVRQPRGLRGPRGKSGHQRAGWSSDRPGETRGKVPQKTNRLRPPSHVNGGPARVKWCGKSAPASRRRDGWANPTRCKVKADRLQVARRGPGRPRRWMAAQRQNPAYRPAKEKPRSGGAFLWVQSLGSHHSENHYRMSRGDLYGTLGAGAQETSATLHTAEHEISDLSRGVPPRPVAFGMCTSGEGGSMRLNCAVPPE